MVNNSVNVLLSDYSAIFYSSNNGALADFEIVNYLDHLERSRFFTLACLGTLLLSFVFTTTFNKVWLAA